MPRGSKCLIILINILVIIVGGAILFYLFDRFVRDGRLANLLKILFVLVCLLAILQRLLPVLGIGFSKTRELFGRNQQCAVEWIDDPCHEGAAVVATKPVALKSILIEMDFGFSAKYELCFALRALYQSSPRNVLLSFTGHHAKQLLGGIPTPFRFGGCLSKNV
jgi:hypothetical protein